MKAEELEAAVLAVGHAEHFADSLIDLFNVGRGEIAGLVDLPALHTVAPVETTAASASVALPSSYYRGLYHVGSAAQRKRIGRRKDDYHNLLSFLEKHPDPALDQAGPITDVVIQGTDLLYQGRDDDVLTLRFYRAPEPLAGGGAVPEELPEHLHRPLLFNYACKEVYNLIEDGIEGNRANHAHYDRLFTQALAALARWAEERKPREPKYVRDTSGGY